MAGKKVDYNRDVFVSGLLQVYEEDCARKGIEKNPCTFIHYCLEHNIVSDSTVNQFAVLKEFERLYPIHDCHKTKTVLEISVNTGLGETKVWGILKNHYQRFRALRKKPKT